jgi:hypothetical protein
MNFRSLKREQKWLVGIVVVVIALGILAGAIAAGRLRFLFRGAVAAPTVGERTSGNGTDGSAPEWRESL